MFYRTHFVTLSLIGHRYKMCAKLTLSLCSPKFKGHGTNKQITESQLINKRNYKINIAVSAVKKGKL